MTTYLWNLHKAISDTIGLADLKAGAIITINAIFWSFLAINLKNVKTFIEYNPPWIAYGLFFILIGMSLLSVISAITGIKPRHKHAIYQSPIFFEAIATNISGSHGSDKYNEAVRSQTSTLLLTDEEKLKEALAREIVELSIVASRKLRMVNIALTFLFSAIIIFALLVITIVIA
jgi:hypothetical protein